MIRLPTWMRTCQMLRLSFQLKTILFMHCGLFLLNARLCPKISDIFHVRIKFCKDCSKHWPSNLNFTNRLDHALNCNPLHLENKRDWCDTKSYADLFTQKWTSKLQQIVINVINVGFLSLYMARISNRP